MKTTHRRDRFARMTNDRYSDAVCPLCEWGIRQGDDVALDQNGEAWSISKTREALRFLHNI